MDIYHLDNHWILAVITEWILADNDVSKTIFFSLRFFLPSPSHPIFTNKHAVHKAQTIFSHLYIHIPSI